MRKIGIYNPHLNTMGGGEKVCIALAEALSEDNKVSLITHKKIDKAKIEKYFNADLGRVNIVVVKPNRFYAHIEHFFAAPGAIKRTAKHLSVYKPIKKLNFDVFVNNCFHSELPSPAPSGVYMCMFPHVLINPNEMNLPKKIYYHMVNLIDRLSLHPSKSSWLDTYQLITANSEYTKSYIKKLWRRDSSVIYPICENMALKDVKKEKIILNVGRFFENNGVNHHKRQDLLIESFKEMQNLHKDGWQLHLLGSVAKDFRGYEYVFELVKAVQGYPIQFHFDATFKEVKELYNKATIYWHATGYGSDPQKYPERQEHFGISTVEAMSASCTPVVIDSAGQREIVSDGVNGYMWQSVGDLSRQTVKAITHPIKYDVLAASIEKYNKKSFQIRVKELNI